MDYIIRQPGQLVWVAAIALLLYVTAVVGFRLGERRTLADMSPPSPPSPPSPSVPWSAAFRTRATPPTSGVP